MNLPTLKDIKDIKDIKGKKVLLRIDLNVPVEDNEIVDDYRIQKILPTIKFLKEKGAHIIILSHHSELGQSLEPIFNYLKELFNVRFVKDIYNKEEFLFTDDDEIILCENLRFWGGETQNDLEFAKHLASLGDFFVNDAFGVSHREHASIVSLPKLLPSYIGFLFEKEVVGLSKIFNLDHPSLLILGGAKISTKLPLVLKLVDSMDSIFIGGALANNFFKNDGFEIGLSIYSETPIDLDKLKKSKKIMLPEDVVVKNKDGVFIKTIPEISAGDKILDAGPKTVLKLKEKIKTSKSILLNGPIGDYIEKGFEKGTMEIIKEISKSDSKSFVGGGDTVGLILKFGFEKSFDFISTGGGAMLEFLTNKTLPGIEAIKK